MFKEEYKNEKLCNNLTNFGEKVKKVNLEIQVDLSQDREEKEIKLPFIIKKKTLPNIQNRKKLRKKLVQIGNFCQSIYNNSNVTMNNTKTVEDVLNDSKLKAINDIKNDYFINQNQSNKEENNISINVNENININNNNNCNNNINYKKLILNKLNRKSFKSIDVKLNYKNINNNNEEKFTYLTTTYERPVKKPNNNNIHYSIDNGLKRKMKYNYGDYASNKLIINHPKLYVLNNNKRENKFEKLPIINRGYKRLNIVEEFSKLLPDKIVLTNEEKRNKYDEYMKMKELKELVK